MDKHAVHWAVTVLNTDGLKLLLSHPNVSAASLNHKNSLGKAPVMLAVQLSRRSPLALLAADHRVDLDVTDGEGRSLEEMARWLFSSSCILVKFSAF